MLTNEQIDAGADELPIRGAENLIFLQDLCIQAKLANVSAAGGAEPVVMATVIGPLQIDRANIPVGTKLYAHSSVAGMPDDSAIIDAIRESGGQAREWCALTYNEGQYEVTTLTMFTKEFVRRVRALGGA